MAETPDFEQLARTSLDRSGIDEPLQRGLMIEGFAEQLRLIWNARGAADLATIDTSLASQMGPTAAGPYVKNLDRELRKLDR